MKCLTAGNAVALLVQLRACAIQAASERVVIRPAEWSCSGAFWAPKVPKPKAFSDLREIALQSVALKFFTRLMVKDCMATLRSTPRPSIVVGGIQGNGAFGVQTSALLVAEKRSRWGLKAAV